MDIKDFELMRDKAELNALSQQSLLEPLNEKQTARFKELMFEYYGVDV